MHPGPADAVPRTPLWAALGGFVLDVVIAVALMLVVALGLVGAERLANDPGTWPNTLWFLAITVVGTGGAAVLTYFLRNRANAAERARSWAIARRRDTGRLVVFAGLGVFAATYLVEHGLDRVGVQLAPGNAGTLLAGLRESWLATLLFAAVLAPAYEELLFRRVLFGRLWEAGRPLLGLVLSSSAFGLAHMAGSGGTPLESVLLFLLYSAMGAVMGWVYWRTGTLWAAIGVHALHNLATCLLVLGGLA